jgi:hypothetical protein
VQRWIVKMSRNPKKERGPGQLWSALLQTITQAMPPDAT